MSAAQRARRDVGSSGDSAASESGVPLAETETGILARVAQSVRPKLAHVGKRATEFAPGPAGSRCLEVLIVAVNQASDVGQWYTVTKELQLTSLQLCEACRSVDTVHLRVDGDTPTTLFTPGDAPRLNPEVGGSSRIPHLRVRCVTWALQSVDLMSDRIDTLAGVEELHFSDNFNNSLNARAWPSRLRKMEFGLQSVFNRSIVGVAWPASLEELDFGRSFNQRIEGVMWPASMKRLAFPGAFNQMIERAVWPVSLRRLKLGPVFNQPIEGAKWPGSLQTLIFGGYFNQPIERAMLPASLKRLTLPFGFNQPIEGVTWPPSLRQLEFGTNFSQPIERVTWPPLLQQLTFGCCFNQPIQGVTWSPSLEELRFGEDFNQPVIETQWPSLRRFTLQGAFSQSLRKMGTAMPSLKRLTLIFPHDQARYGLLRGIEWPSGLQYLGIAGHPDVHLKGVEIPSKVAVFYLGS